MFRDNYVFNPLCGTWKGHRTKIMVGVLPVAQRARDWQGYIVRYCRLLWYIYHSGYFYRENIKSHCRWNKHKSHGMSPDHRDLRSANLSDAYTHVNIHTYRLINTHGMPTVGGTTKSIFNCEQFLLKQSKVYDVVNSTPLIGLPRPLNYMPRVPTTELWESDRPIHGLGYWLRRYRYLC